MPTCQSWTKSRAFSLVELAIAIVVIAVITLSASQLLLSATDNQLTQRLHSHHVGVLSTVVSQLRADMERSVQVGVPTLGGASPATGNQLQFQLSDGTVITYAYTGSNITRSEAGVSVSYVALMPPRLQATTVIECASPCFSLRDTTQVALQNLSVRDTSPTGSAFDQEFGNASFQLPEVIVNKMAGFTFQ